MQEDCVFTFRIVKQRKVRFSAYFAK